MTLGQLLSELASEQGRSAREALLGDPVLLRRIEIAGAEFDETTEEYIIGATRRFANAASDEDWLGLMTALENADVPARAALSRMVDWAIEADRAGLEAPASGCGCGGAGTGACKHGEGGA